VSVRLSISLTTNPKVDQRPTRRSLNLERKREYSGATGRYDNASTKLQSATLRSLSLLCCKKREQRISKGVNSGNGKYRILQATPKYQNAHERAKQDIVDSMFLVMQSPLEKRLRLRFVQDPVTGAVHI